jgi:ribosome maturation factor RimP
MLRDPLDRSGLDLEDVEISTAGRRRLVRVLVDKDGGVTLDEIADATRLVSGLLDSSDVLGEAPYTLEVTSPGIDRPLSRPRHWQRNVDRLVKVRPREGQPFTSRIVSADDDAVVLDGDGVRRQVAYASIAKATIEVEFNRPARTAKPGKE